MARVNICGFETGDSSESGSNATGAGSVSFQNSIARTGYALRINIPTSSDAAWVPINALDVNGNPAAGNSATFYFRTYFYVATLPSTGTQPIWAVNDTASAHKLTVRIDSNGNLSAWNGNTQLGSTGSTVLSTAVWYRVENQVGSGASAFWEIRINGVSEISGTNVLGSSLNNGSVWLGVEAGFQNIDCYFDDIAIDDAAYPGDGAIIRFDPTADVAKTNWTDQGGGTTNIFNSVDDFASQAGHDTDTTYIKTSTSGVVTYTASFATMASKGVLGTVHEVKFVALGRDTGTTLTYRIALRPSSNSVQTTALDGGSTYALRAILYKTSGGTDALTIANMDTCQASFVHVQNNARELRCTAMAMMVDCAPYAVATFDKGGSIGEPSAMSHVNLVSV
jgi:hypothetical protein